MHSAKKRLWIEILLHLLFWAGVFYVLTSLDNSHIQIYARRPGPHIARDHRDEAGVSTYVYIILLSLALLFYGNVFWVFRKVIRYKRGVVRLSICTGWFALVFGTNYLIDGPLFNQANPDPVPPPPQMRARIDSAMRAPHPDTGFFRPPSDAVNFTVRNWLHMQPVILFAFLVIEGIAIGYFFLKEWAKSELRQTQLQANQLSTEIKFLKSQINPHFLFNTLNNLFSMAQAKENDELADGILKLSGMMRYMLYDSNEERVPLGKEITYLEECITLNKLRYADEEVTVTFDHPGQTADVRIAPMLFIPFVENAFKHGVAIGQKATIHIAIVVSGQKLIFDCVNTDYSFIKKMEMEISGIGLENVKRRLELAYPGKHQLSIKHESGKFMVNLEIDLS
ncbi:MAG: sensor histidine kinase [Niastella sp.]|jgi:two-component system LytT family sensor kinase|uniref:sensor histidine kinase n=1 Tax=Niastella sp. TaxID=1869183 RepID=UPI00389A8AB9